MHTLSTTTLPALAYNRDEDYDLAQASDTEGVKRLNASVEGRSAGARSSIPPPLDARRVLPAIAPTLSGCVRADAGRAGGHVSTDAGSPLTATPSGSGERVSVKTRLKPPGASKT
jgi:hypothetical protein